MLVDVSCEVALGVLLHPLLHIIHKCKDGNIDEWRVTLTDLLN